MKYRINVTRWVEIDGTFKNATDNEFNEEYKKWFESRGWSYSGMIKNSEVHITLESNLRAEHFIPMFNEWLKEKGWEFDGVIEDSRMQ